MSNFYKVLGNKLKQEREAKERSMSWVARKVEMGVSSYRRIELAMSHSDMGKIQAICDALEIDFKCFLKSVIDEM